MGLIRKFIIQVHVDGFGWQKFESLVEPNIESGWLAVHLENGTHFFQLSRVNQYTIMYEVEE